LDDSIGKTKKLLASNIKYLRKKRGFSQESLAEVAYLSAQTISDIEGYRTWVSDKTLENLARALNVSVSQLFMPSLEDALAENFLKAVFSSHLEELRSGINDEIDATRRSLSDYIRKYSTPD
jgi:transcriptional regulator with XRE-family HTH domain